MPTSTSIAMALDPVVMAQAAGYPELDPWQQTALRSTHPRQLYNASRQIGKSTVIALLSMHCLLFTPNSLVLMVAPSLRQSSLLFRASMDIYRALGRPVAATVENRLSLELENGSRLVALPGSEGTIRGYSGLSLLCCDESSRIPDPLLASITPMLAVSGGRLIAASTPAGKRGWWWRAWEQEGEKWQRFMVKASDCPRIEPAFLAEELKALGPTTFRQEYMGEFVNDVNSVFPEFLLQRIISEEEHSWKIPPPKWQSDSSDKLPTTHNQSRVEQPQTPRQNQRAPLGMPSPGMPYQQAYNQHPPTTTIPETQSWTKHVAKMGQRPSPQGHATPWGEPWEGNYYFQTEPPSSQPKP